MTTLLESTEPVARTGVSARLLAGPGAVETLAAQTARLGPLPPARQRPGLVDALDRSGLLGRGGAAFPVARKWRAVADRTGDDAVVVVNGAEGEPLSAKDRTLMTLRPQLVLDGAVLAADAVGADQILVYVGTEHRGAVEAMGRAIAERPVDEGQVQAPSSTT